MTPHAFSRILLLGATSQVGVFALGQLLREGFRVTALSRMAGRRVPGSVTPAVSTGVEWLNPECLLAGSANLHEPAVPEGMHEIDAVFSCGPVTLADAWVRKCPAVRRVVCLSTSSLYSKQDSADSAERRLISSLKRAEENLKAQCRERDIDLLVLRPTLIYGCGLDANVSRIARLVRKLRFFPVAGKASGLRQPVHAEDLAATGLAALNAGTLKTAESPIGGGSILSYREMVEKVFIAFGLKPRIVSVPPGLLATAARTAAWLPWAGDLNAQFVYRQNIDLVFDDTALREWLPVSTRPFAPSVADFRVPEALARLQPRRYSGL